MTTSIFVLGEALMDCIAQPDGQFKPVMGGSPFNLARAAALRGASVSFLNPMSSDRFGLGLTQLLQDNQVQLLGGTTPLPTSLAVVQVDHGQPSYGFYREGIADRDYSVEGVLNLLRQHKTAGILHTGSLLLIPPEHQKVLRILAAARDMGWTISVDINLRPKVTHDLAAYVQALREVIKLTDWLKASDEDLSTLGYSEVAMANAAGLVRALRQDAAPSTLRRIALTFGGDGAYLAVEDLAHCQVAPRIPLVDSVGAGDTFWGNALADWAMAPAGAAQRVATTLDLCIKAAAINCMRVGCQPPTLAELETF